MALQLNLEGSAGVWIDGNHTEFDDTQFAGGTFRVKVQPITRTMFSAAQKKNTRIKRGVETTDQVSANRQLFLVCVKELEGLNGGDGQPLKCDNPTLSKLAEQYMEFATAVVNAALKAQEVQDDGKELELGN